MKFCVLLLTLRLLVGTYTEGNSAEGVYLYDFDPQTASTDLKSVAPSGNPSFVVASGNKVYSVNEYNDGREGVSAYIIDDNSICKTDSLIIPRDIVNGADPCNLLLAGNYLISSNYTGGSVTVFRLRDDGTFNGIAQWFSFGFEISSLFSKEPLFEQAHLHCAALSPDGKYVFAVNLGNDCIHRFELGAGDYPLSRPETAWRAGGLRFFGERLSELGPRHMIFSQDGRFAYLLCELSDKLIVFEYKDGQLSPIQKLRAYKGKGHGSADLHLSPDGRFLYTSHRLKDDGIAVFSVDQTTGKVSAAGSTQTGLHPRNFAISPDGRFMLVACRDSNRIEIYSIDPESGLLSQTNKSIKVDAPVCVQFID